MKPYPVKVVWYDAAEADVAWVDRAAAIEPVEVVSVGWLIAKSDTRLVLASDIQTDNPDLIAGVQVIPRDWAQKITKL
jgi:hypothetical protein